MAILMVILQYWVPLHFWQHWYIQPKSFDFYCELVVPSSFFREPISSWSNLIYWYFGWWILFDTNSNQQKASILSSNPIYSYLYGLLFLYMFCGSLFFHASMANIAVAIDMSGVYAFCIFPLMISLHSMYNLARWKKTDVCSNGFVFFTVIIIFLFASILGYWENSFDSKPTLLFSIFLNGILIWTIEQKLSQTGVKLTFNSLLKATLFFVLAICCWIIDRYRIFCEPEGWLHGHAFWHLFAGVGIFYLYLYFRTARNELTSI